MAHHDPFSLARYHRFTQHEKNPFNRFLKYYHLLEMHFDMHTAVKIRTLVNESGKEKEISKLLKEYNREDIERLKSLLETYADHLNIAIHLHQVFNFKNIAEEIFYDYGKSSNPLPSRKAFNELFQSGSFSEDKIRKCISGTMYSKFICHLAAYWIYRIRSSIAHHKLGEYIMKSSDEAFIVKFAEPLINNIFQDFSINYKIS